MARGVNYATQRVMTNGSGQLLEYGDIPMAGKTGTNDARSQTWFMGYNSGMVTASWVGNWQGEGDTSSLGGLEIGGQVYPEIDGSLIAAPSWARFMQQIPGLYVGAPFANPPAGMISGQRSTNPGRNSGNNNGTNSGGTGTGGTTGGTTGGQAGNSGNGGNG
ncbi:hypothetical protein CVO76_10515 [Arthrobacter agilis]|uniref:Penicillin-binding protein transpeptidase domain-containing protein n=1 Tax=Arthrobacter agilis TaxID=37921 RepID=A0A2L0UFJ0_9MICC|nr:hypothetical protein CVO76_10515 [Arthrobacter agilis]